MMHARSELPGTAPPVQSAAVLKLPPAGLVQSVVQFALRAAQPSLALVAPTAAIAVAAAPPLGTGTVNEPEIAPAGVAVTVAAKDRWASRNTG
jgi:hypothetical protein